MKNSVKSRMKLSKLERSTNQYIVLVALMQLSVSLVAAVMNSLWEIIQSDQFTYLRSNDATADEEKLVVHFLLSLGTWFIGMCNLVPISLLVTQEVVKFLQA